MVRPFYENQAFLQSFVFTDHVFDKAQAFILTSKILISSRSNVSVDNATLSYIAW